MQRVDRLLIKVRRAYGQSDKQLSLAFIDYVTDGEHAGQWKARADLWDGKEGSFKPEDRVTSYHSTQEEAIEAIKAVEEAHAPIGLYKPMFEDVPIIINDIGYVEDDTQHEVAELKEYTAPEEARDIQQN